MKDVIHAIIWRAGPDMHHSVAHGPDVFQVAQHDLMVESRAMLLRSEEVQRVHILNIHPPPVWWWALPSIFLDMHGENAHIHSVDSLECNNGFAAEGELQMHLAHHCVTSAQSALQLHSLLTVGHHANGKLHRIQRVFSYESLHAMLQVVTQMGFCEIMCPVECARNRL